MILYISYVTYDVSGGPTLVKYVKEVSHVKHMHADFGPPQFLFEINVHVTQFVRKPTFGPLSN